MDFDFGGFLDSTDSALSKFGFGGISGIADRFIDEPKNTQAQQQYEQIQQKAPATSSIGSSNNMMLIGGGVAALLVIVLVMKK